MPLSEEDKAEIASLLAESVNGLKESLQLEFTKQIGGVMKRSKDAIASSAASIKNEIEEGITQSLTQFKAPVTGGENTISPGQENAEVKESVIASVSDQKLGQLADQIKRQTQAFLDLEKKYENSEKARIESEKSAKRSRLESDFIAKATEKVVDPQTFLKVLTDQGKIIELEDRLVVKTGELNPDGSENVVSAESQIDSFLSHGLNYFAKARPGTGVGSSVSNSTLSSKSAYFNDSTTADEIFKALKDGKENEVLNEFS